MYYNKQFKMTEEGFTFQLGYEKLHSIKVNGIEITIKQTIIDPCSAKKFFSFLVSRQEKDDYQVIASTFNRAEAWRKYKEYVNKLVNVF